MDFVPKVILVAGARPNFMKLAPLHRAMIKRGNNPVIVHTGQHYDHNMSQLFFDELEIPKPDINLEVGSSSHAVQTADIMKLFEQVCVSEKPDLVVVFGDINSTIACALVAKKMHIRVAHVEAGLRSGDMGMPEEINRILTDHISDFLFTTSEIANKNLVKEGLNENQIFLVGNIMIDTLSRQLPKINKSKIIEELNLNKHEYDLLTLHRPSNVDDEDRLESVMNQFNTPEFPHKIIFPTHPRTRSRIERIAKRISLQSSNIICIEPLGYNDFLQLQSHSRSVWTDSGGIQEETSWLGVPCFTVRENTERPETIIHGTNILVNNKQLSFSSYIKNANLGRKEVKIDLWDGKTAGRIADKLISLLQGETYTC